MKYIEKGFTLFEVLVAMFITGVALLGLAQMEVYILKSSQSSLNYTVASIRANSFVDHIWMDLCHAQSVTSASTYTQIRSDWINELSAAGMTSEANSPASTASQNMSVTVNWSDPRFIDDDDNNSLTLQTTFPDSGCG